MVKLNNWCIFYVGVASTLMLCNGQIRIVIVVFSGSTLSWSGLTLKPITLPTQQVLPQQQTPGSSNCDRTWLWWIRSLVISFLFLSLFLYFFLSFFYNPSVIGPDTPHPQTPQALQGGEEVCSVCQRRANVSAIISPPLFPITEGEGRGQRRCLKARHTVGLSTLYRCWLLCDDQPLSWRMFPCQLKNTRFFYSWHKLSSLFLLWFNDFF